MATTGTFAATSMFTQYLDRGSSYSSSNAAQGTRYQTAQSNPQQKLVGVIFIPSLANVAWNEKTIISASLTHASVYSYTRYFRLYRSKLSSVDRTKKGSAYVDIDAGYTEIDSYSDQSLDTHTAPLSSANIAWLLTQLKAGYTTFCIFYDENAPTTAQSFSQHYAAASTWSFSITYDYARSKIDSVSNAEIEGKTTVNWTNYSGAFVRKIKFVFGSVNSGEIVVAGSSYEYTLPSSWYAQIPNATRGTATVYLYTYNGNTLVGSDSKTFTVTVKSSIVPTISSFACTSSSDNEEVESWGIAVQKYSKPTFTARASAGSGATIAKYVLIGPNVSYTLESSSGSFNFVGSNYIASGRLQYTLTVTDSRGRSKASVINVDVTAYSNPSILSVIAKRCNVDGTINDTTGVNAKAYVSFEWSDIGDNEIATQLSYKKHSDSSYTVVSGGFSDKVWTNAFGNNLIAIDSTYDIKVRIYDSLNNASQIVFQLQSVVGYSFGLNNDRVRFGGVVEKAGFQNDLTLEQNADATFNAGILTLLGDLSQTGRFVQHNPSAVSVASSTWTNVAQLALTEGVWLLFYTAAFAANSTGRRQSIIATAADSTSPINYMVRDSENAVVDAMTYLDSVDVRTVGSSGVTYYLNVWHNAGTSLSTIGRLYAIRIC